MIEKFIKPKFKKIVSEKLNNRTYTKRFQLEKLDRGFANTIGTSLRRVLLSSIPGAAVFAVEIKGVSHEFSAIDHVREDVVGVILNIKNLILSIEEKAIEEDDVFELKLKSKSGVVKAKDIQTPSEIKIVNGDLELANTTKDNALDMTLYVAYSKGFKSFEENRALVKDKLGEKRGIITIDSNFSPVEKVNLKVEEVNPGESRVFERLIMDVTTKGNVEVEKVMAFAGKVLETIFATFGELEVVDIDKNFTDVHVFSGLVPRSRLYKLFFAFPQ